MQYRLTQDTSSLSCVSSILPLYYPSLTHTFQLSRRLKNLLRAASALLGGLWAHCSLLLLLQTIAPWLLTMLRTAWACTKLQTAVCLLVLEYIAEGERAHHRYRKRPRPATCLKDLWALCLPVHRDEDHWLRDTWHPDLQDFIA